MKIIVDSNIAFSAMLNLNSRIGQVLIKSGNLFSFFSIPQLMDEIFEYKDKIIDIAHYTENEFNEISRLVFHKIEFIEDTLIPKHELLKAEKLCENVDIDDAAFVALTNYLRGKLWTGDKALRSGLEDRKWSRFVSVEALYSIMIEKGK